MSEQITISLQEYYNLLQSDAQLTLLKNRGIDNWQGYGSIAPISDFDSLVEWRKYIDSLDNESW